MPPGGMLGSRGFVYSLSVAVESSCEERGMNQDMFLEGAKVYLNPSREDDIPMLVKFMNEDVIRLVGRNNGSIVYENIFKERFTEREKKDELFSIFKKENDSIIGDMSLNSMDRYNRSAMISIVIYGDENRGRGYGREAILLLLKHAFIDINLESVHLGTWEFNKRAIHLYESIGFKNIGRRRNSRIVGNKYFDEVMMDMISCEYFDLYGNKELEKYDMSK